MSIDERAFGHTVKHCKDLGLSLTEAGVKEIVGIYLAHVNRQPVSDKHRIPDGRPIFGEDSPHDIKEHLDKVCADQPIIGHDGLTWWGKDQPVGMSHKTGCDIQFDGPCNCKDDPLADTIKIEIAKTLAMCSGNHKAHYRSPGYQRKAEAIYDNIIPYFTKLGCETIKRPATMEEAATYDMELASTKRESSQLFDEISVDVSTGEHDANLRAFAKMPPMEIMEHHGKHIALFGGYLNGDTKRESGDEECSHSYRDVVKVEKCSKCGKQFDGEKS